MMQEDSVTRRLFVGLMMLSGLAGISYEILYGRILGNIIGDQFIVSAAVLMTFLLGIGLGAMYAHRLWRWLWAIEAGIGIYGLLMVAVQPWLEPLVYSASALFGGSLAGSVLVCVLLLIAPALLIGCSVPLFAGYFARMQHGGSGAFAHVYMVYNLGAALTALLIEFYLIRSLGVRGTVTLFALVNLLIAAGLRCSAVGPRQPHGRRWQTLVFRLPDRMVAALVLASVASAIFQLFMVKYAELVFGPFRESFALVLSLVLLGITLGSRLVRRFSPGFTTVMWWNLAGLLWLMLAAGGAIYVYAALYPLAGDSFWQVVLLKWLVLALLMLVPATSFGATIPALLTSRGEISQESGTLLFISSIANVCGFLLMVFLLHRYLDYGVQLLVVATISLLALLVFEVARLRRLLAAGLLLAAMGGAFAGEWDEDLLYLSYTKFKSVTGLMEERKRTQSFERYKGYQDVFSINRVEGEPYFFINGYISIPLNNPSEKIVGALSTLYAPRLDDALVLGLGSGATASSAGLFFDHTDVVEINPVVRENLFRMAEWNFDIEHNPRITIHVDDAIHFVKAGGKNYSLILNTVTTPLYFSSSKLYTKDFFDDVKRRLTPDGVYVTWMDSRIGDVGAGMILRTLQASFRHCAALYVKGAYFLLVASDQPLVMTQQQAVTTQSELRDNLMQRYGIMSEWLPYHLMTTDLFALPIDPELPLNTADDPVLEFEIASLQKGGIPEFRKKLEAHFDIAEIRQAMTSVPAAFPADFLAHARARLGRSSIEERWQTLLAAEDSQARRDLAELELRRVRMEVVKGAREIHAYAYQLMKLKRYREAITYLQRVQAMAPAYDNASYNLGVCFELLGDEEQALENFRHELVVDPADQDASYRIARLLLRMQRYEQALAALDDYLQRPGPLQARAYFYRAAAHKALGHADQARVDLLQAMQLGPIDRALAEQLHLL
ncbi:tetratricopeptide repeat protein [Mariprofundus erugo]|uniref:Tetratricopeptide repeat protein n=2 Tax=Mariprofundus erugo TaxID=2528639 RepID=A0A5R9GVQ7_9PROT|nr:tetratricopeptide repeat protein [Mariprofundus erugo]